MDFYKRITKKDRIRTFLKYLASNQFFSEPMVGYSEKSRRITLLPDKESVFVMFSLGEFNGLKGEFSDTWIEEVKSNPTSFYYFNKIWKLIDPLTVKPSCCWPNCRLILLLTDSIRQSLARTSRSKSHSCAAIS